MIDVFLRWWPQTPMRRGLANAVYERLLHYPDIRVHLVTSAIPEPYHIESKRSAEELAKSDIYCVIDDDHMPVNRDFFQKGIEALGNNPEYGMLTARLLIEHQPYSAAGEVTEVHAIGCPYFVRKGTLSFPDGRKEQYDGVLSKVVTDKGLKTGIANKALCNHLGYGFSQIFPEHNSAN